MPGSSVTTAQAAPGHASVPGSRIPHGVRIAVLVCVAHGLNDLYAAFLPPLLPRIMDRLALDMALAATLGTVFSVSASILQPAAGYAADRFGRRGLVVAGPVLSGVFLSMMGWAPTFWVLTALLAAGGIGSALFHPPGAAYAAAALGGVGPGRRGLRFSIFSVGGALGFALGPLVAIAIVGRVGLEGLWVAMIPVLLLAPVLYRGLPAETAFSGSRRLPPGPREILGLLMGPLGLVFVISACAAFAQRSFLTFLPIMAVGEGVSEASAALVLSIYLGGQAVGSLTGGVLTDRMDRRRLIAGITLVALPAHLLAVGLPPASGAAMVAAALAGMTNMALLPPLVILAQQLVPSGAAVASGVAMGFAWGVGSLGLPLVGVVADGVGPRLAALGAVCSFGMAFLVSFSPALGRVSRER